MGGGRSGALQAYATFTTAPGTELVASATIDVGGAEEAMTFGYTAVDQLETVSLPDGNDDGNPDKTTTFAYDSFRRLASVTAETDGVTSETFTFTYGGTSWRRTSATWTKYETDGTTVLESVTSKYEYDEFNLIRQSTSVDGGTPVVTEYVYFQDKPMWEVTDGGVKTYVYENRNVSALRLADGTVEQVRVYDACGFVESDSTTTENVHLSRPGYKGEFQDVKTGLVFMRHRYYWPALGRFTQRDPAAAGVEVGEPQHAYAKNDPVNFDDPTEFFVFSNRFLRFFSRSDSGQEVTHRFG